MLRSYKAALFLEDPPLHNPMVYSVAELTEEDFAERANRQRQYRHLGYVKCRKEIDIKGEWAQFCALVGLRLLPDNNFPNGQSVGKSFDQWLDDAGVKRFRPHSLRRVAKLPNIYLNYID